MGCLARYTSYPHQHATMSDHAPHANKSLLFELLLIFLFFIFIILNI